MDFDANLSAVWWVLVATIALHVPVLRRLVDSALDPLVAVALGTTTAVTMAFALTGASLELARVTACVLLFWLGTWLAWPARPSPRAAAVLAQPAPPARRVEFLRIVAVATAMYLLANLLFFVVAGAPALSDNPSVAKVESYAGGFGWVRRLDWGLGVFVTVALVYLLLTTRLRWVRWSLAGVVVICALSGSKSGLVPVVFAMVLLPAHAALAGRRAAGALRLRLLLPILVVGAVGVSLGVLLVEQGGDPVAAGFALLLRLLYSSDVLIYWNEPIVRHTFQALGPLDYPGNVLASTLGLLRLVPYDAPIGAVMVQVSLGAGQEVSESLGPNLPFYVKGALFFGPVQYVYCLFVGLAMGWLRRLYARASGARPLKLCLLATITVMSPALAVDDALFVSTVTDFGVFFAFAWLVASLWPDVGVGATPAPDGGSAA